MKYTILDHDPAQSLYLIGNSNGDIEIRDALMVESCKIPFQQLFISPYLTVNLAMLQRTNNRCVQASEATPQPIQFRVGSLQLKQIRAVGWDKTTHGAFDFVDGLWCIYKTNGD